MFQIFICLGICTFLSSALHASELLDPGLHVQRITTQERERLYHLYIPQTPTNQETYPVVFLFHGGGGQSLGILKEGAWMAKADQEGFIVVAPNGTRADPNKPARFRNNGQSWNDGSQRTMLAGVKQQSKDIEFVKSIITELNKQTKINNKQIYACGFSNGAAMTFRVGRELSKTFAAIAPIAGNDFLTTHKPDRDIPLLYITGTADPLNPISGGEIFIGMKSFGHKEPIKNAIDRWKSYYHCNGEGVIIYDANNDIGHRFINPQTHAQIEVYLLGNHGHHWPGVRAVLPEIIVGKNISKLNATDVLWEFFSRHQLPE